jgi:hypothetical protein
VTRNHTGHRIGACHQRAVLSSEQVKAMRADYIPYVFGLTKVARKYNCARATARDICQYATRVTG